MFVIGEIDNEIVIKIEVILGKLIFENDVVYDIVVKEI